MLQAFTEKGENTHYHQRQSMSYYIKSQYVFLLLYETKTEMLEKKSRVIKTIFKSHPRSHHSFHFGHANT